MLVFYSLLYLFGRIEVLWVHEDKYSEKKNT